MSVKYTATPNHDVVCTHTVVLARCRTAEEAEQLISLLNSGFQRMVDDWLAQNDGLSPVTFGNESSGSGESVLSSP